MALGRSIMLSVSSGWKLKVRIAVLRRQPLSGTVLAFRHQPGEQALLVHFEKLGKVLEVDEARLTNNKYLAVEVSALADLCAPSHLQRPHFICKAWRDHRRQASRQGLVGRHHFPPSLKEASIVIEQSYPQFQPLMQGK